MLDAQESSTHLKRQQSNKAHLRSLGRIMRLLICTCPILVQEAMQPAAPRGDAPFEGKEQRGIADQHSATAQAAPTTRSC